jgi:hypothetical protein
MWFDAQAELAKLVGGREIDAPAPATAATSATPSQRIVPNVANVARVATPRAPEIKPHEETAGGRVTTWTGCVVSLDEWRRLTAWERHGPDGRFWCCDTFTWINRKGA